MRGLLTTAFAVLAVSAVSFSIDKEVLENYNRAFSQLDHDFLAKSYFKVTPQKVLEMIKKGEDVVLLDIRTEAEQSIVGLTFKNSLNIPIDKLFTEENLKKLPKDKKIIVVCHSGVRAAAATGALRSLGFDNAYFLAGGIAALADYVKPETTVGIKK